MHDNNGNEPSAGTGSSSGGKRRWIRICAITGAVAGVVVIWMFGVNLWTILAFVLLVGCPVAIVGMLVIDRQSAGWKR